MAKKGLGNIIASWAFLIGVLIALISGILAALGKTDLSNPTTTIILMCLGIVIGLFNINAKEASSFLLSGMSLIIASVFGVSIASSVPAFYSTLLALLAIFVPATIVVAIRNVFLMAKN